MRAGDLTQWSAGLACPIPGFRPFKPDIVARDYSSSIGKATVISSRLSSATQAVGGQPRTHKILSQTNKINGLRNSGLLKKSEPPRKIIRAKRGHLFPTNGSYVSQFVWLWGSGPMIYTH